MGGRKIAFASLAIGCLLLVGCGYDSIMEAVKAVAGGGGVAAPVFSKAGGVYNNDISVTISGAAEGVLIRYTVDGSTPTRDYGTPYQGTPIPITVTTTVKAVAYRPGGNQSDVTTAVYTLRAATPTFSPDGGIYGSSQSVAIASGTTGATIRYTINGSNPTAGSTLYSTPVPVSDSTTLPSIGPRSSHKPRPTYGCSSISKKYRRTCCATSTSRQAKLPMV